MNGNFVITPIVAFRFLYAWWMDRRRVLSDTQRVGLDRIFGRLTDFMTRQPLPLIAVPGLSPIESGASA